MTSKTYKFDKSLFNTHLSGRHLAVRDGQKFYARFAKGEDTIVEKEQSEFAKISRIFVDKEYMTITDQLAQEFIESRPDFGTRIVEHDPAAEHKKNLENISFAAETITKLVSLESSQVRGLGYRVFGSTALTRDENQLKGLLIAKANEDPAKISKMINEKTETDFAMIGVAMAKDIIYEAKGGNEVRFKDTDEVIVTVRKGERPIDALAQMLNTSDGREIKKQIFLKLTPVAAKELYDKQKTGQDTDLFEGDGNDATEDDAPLSAPKRGRGASK